MSYFANFNPARVARALLQLVGRNGKQDRAEIATLSRGLIHPVTGETAFYVARDGTLKAGTSSNIISGASLDSSVIQLASGTISDTEMKALRATPKTLVAAPGAGYVLEFISATLYFDRTAAYTETTDNMAVKYGDGAGTVLSEAIEATGFVDAAGDALLPIKQAASIVLTKAATDNKALVLHNTGDGEYGGGNAANVVRFKVAYRVHAAGW